MSTKIKFELASENRPVVLVPVKINGKGPYDFVLDTGAVICTISSSLTKSLGIKTVSTRELSLIPEGDRIKQQVSLGKAEFEIGALRLTNVEVAIADLSMLCQMAGRELHGIIGHSLLKDLIVTIDYPNGLVRLTRESGRHRG